MIISTGINEKHNVDIWLESINPSMFSECDQLVVSY